MFEPSQQEILEHEDLFTQLLSEGRKLMRTPEAHRSRLDEQRDFVAARAARAAAQAMEKLQWRPRLAIAMIARCTCSNCGSETRAFAGFGVQMVRNSDQATRIVMAQCLDQAYPRETRFTDTITPACMACVSALGFEV